MESGRRCNRHKPYKCANGQCARGPTSCHFSGYCSKHPRYRYRCPEGNCVTYDFLCIRRCGFEQSNTSPNAPFPRYYKYKYQCKHYPFKCGLNPTDCPSRCRYPDYYACPITGECKPNFHWCESCSEFRCDNGVCYTRKQRCDQHNDCGDWSDETCDGSDASDLHPVATTNSPDSFLQPWTIVMISGGVILLMLATVYIVLRRYGPKCRRGCIFSNQNSPTLNSPCSYANDPSLCLWNTTVEGRRLSYIHPQDSPAAFILSRASRSQFRETPMNPPSYMDVMSSEQYSPYPEDSLAPPSYFEAILAAASAQEACEPTGKRITTTVTATQTSSNTSLVTETVV